MERKKPSCWPLAGFYSNTTLLGLTGPASKTRSCERDTAEISDGIMLQVRVRVRDSKSEAKDLQNYVIVKEERML